MYNYQPAEIMDFSGGITDDYMNGPINQAYILKNFFILNNKSIKTRSGTLLDSTTDAQVPVGTQRIQTLISYNNSDKLFVQTGKKIYYRNPVNYASLLGPTGNDALHNLDAATAIANTQWNRHLIITTSAFDRPIKIYKDNSSNYQLRSAGLPPLASAPILSGTPGQEAYIYGFYHIYTYTIQDQTFVDFGPVTYVEILNIDAPNIQPITISAIPVLANTVNDNWDTVNIKIGVARTISGGTELYKVSEVTNGAVGYVDIVSDDTLQNNEGLYTNGDVPDNDPPPLAKFCYTVNGFTYYGHFKVGSQIFPSKIRQSQGLDPDSVPASYEDELEDEITGMSSVQDIPIVGCRKHIYRIDGTFDEQGRGGMNHRRISDHAGCISHESFVQAEGGLFWWGNDGIYYSDGFKVNKVTSHLNTRYQDAVNTLNGKTAKIKGVFNPDTRMIHWTFSANTKVSGQEECDSIWTIDLQWGISDSMSCHIWEGYASFAPTALTVHNSTLHRGDKTGYVLYFDVDTFTDPRIVAGTPVAGWFEESIIWTYRSVASNFGTSFVRKIANKILLSCKNETNVSIALTATNDDGKITRILNPIRWRKNFTWGDEEFIWGSEDCVWYYGGTIEVDRRFPAKNLRYNYLQMEFTNEYVNIVNSDGLGLAAVDSVLGTATLVDSAISDWPSEAVDYFIYFAHDNYTKPHKITARTADTLTVDDMTTLMTGNWKWQIKGYRKNEILNLIGYSISFALLSRSYDTASKGEAGGLSGV